MYLVIVWVSAWILIIIIHAIGEKLCNSDLKLYGDNYVELVGYEKCEKEMVKDGNNLFATGLLYIIGNVVSYYVNNDVLSWVILIITFAFVIPMIFSSVIMIKQMIYIKNKYVSLMTITGIINTIVQLIISINIYFGVICR